MLHPDQYEPPGHDYFPYAPTESGNDEAKHSFYEKFE